jgi:hypothetical protein
MAKIEKCPAGLVIEAETAAEIEMLEAREEVVLDDGLYSVGEGCIILSANASLATAQRIKLAFIKAALAEQKAKLRRDSFRLL